MRKLFLTSGIIACMACPAFATGSGFQGTGDMPNISVPSGTQEGACKEPVLGATSGDVQLQAMWEKNFHQINLNMNTEANGAIASPDVDPDQIWSVPGTSGIYNSYTGTIGQADFTPANLVVGTTAAQTSGTSSITMSADNGHTVTYGFNYSAPHGRTGSGDTTATTETRYLTKFTSGATDVDGASDDYITVSRSGNTTTYTLTDAGASAASNYSRGGTATEWYAQYDCATPTITNSGESLNGYTFTGWKDSSGATVTTAGRCETDASTTLYAQWDPIDYTINFDCNSQGTATGSLVGSNNVSIEMDNYVILDQYCTMPGYVFTGWSCGSATGSTGALSTAEYDDANRQDLTSIAANNSHTLDNTTAYLTTYGNVTCTAQWQENTITLHWDANNATTVTSTGGNSCTYDDAVVVPNVSRTGYVLTGWSVADTYTAPGVNTANTTNP